MGHASSSLFNSRETEFQSCTTGDLTAEIQISVPLDVADVAEVCDPPRTIHHFAWTLNDEDSSYVETGDCVGAAVRGVVAHGEFTVVLGEAILFDEDLSCKWVGEGYKC